MSRKQPAAIISEESKKDIRNVFQLFDAGSEGGICLWDLSRPLDRLYYVAGGRRCFASLGSTSPTRRSKTGRRARRASLDAATQCDQRKSPWKTRRCEISRVFATSGPENGTLLKTLTHLSSESAKARRRVTESLSLIRHSKRGLYHIRSQ